MWRRRTDENDPGVRARTGRGWGPFSGGQLTAIILGALLAVAFPVGAYAAVSGSNVFVTDATSGTRAGVTSAGKMKVDTGLSVFGMVPTYSQGGTVYAPTAAPGDLFTAWENAYGTTPTVLATAPAGKALVLQNMSINSVYAPARHYITLYIGNLSCSSFVQVLQYYDFPEGDEYRQVSLEPGIAVPANSALCVRHNLESNVYMHVTGYKVPANTIPAAAAAAAAGQSGAMPERTR